MGAGSMRYVGLSAVILIMAGCVGSTPPRLYTLDMHPSATVPAAVNIEVERLRPLDALSRNEILIRRGDNVVDYFPLDQWASNIGEMTARKLSAEFGPIDRERPTVILTGDIVAFELVETGTEGAHGHVSLVLEARKKGESRYSAPALSKTYNATTPVGLVTPVAVVTALSQAVATIAGEIASDIGSIDLTLAPAPVSEDRLHTLVMTSSGKAKPEFNIDVTSLRRSESLARDSILMRTGPTSVEYFTNDRWASSVSTLVTEKLEAEFGAPEAGRDTVEVFGSILAFERLDAADGSEGHVKLDLTLKRAAEGDSPLSWKVYDVSAPAASASAEDVATALSEALSQIAVEIASDASRIPMPDPKVTVPIHLHTLDMTPSGKVQCKYNVSFERIQPNDSLMRANIVIVQNQTTVDHFDNDRWASSLAELVPEKLAAEFGPSVDGRPTVAVSGAISGFEQVENGEGPFALVKLSVNLRWAESEFESPIVRRVYEAKTKIEGDDATATVQAMSRSLEEVAVKLAAEIDALPVPERNTTTSAE